MVTTMDSLLAHQRRGEVARELDSERLDRKRRASRPPSRGLRWAFWLSQGIGPPDATPAPPKIRRLRDADVPTRP